MRMVISLFAALFSPAYEADIPLKTNRVDMKTKNPEQDSLYPEECHIAGFKKCLTSGINRFEK